MNCHAASGWATFFSMAHDHAYSQPEDFVFFTGAWT